MAQGSRLFAQGDAVSRVYFVMDGEVDLRVHEPLLARDAQITLETVFRAGLVGIPDVIMKSKHYAVSAVLVSFVRCMALPVSTAVSPRQMP